MKNTWSRLSITKKVFILTASIFSLFLTLLFIGQLFFFEKYYTYTIRRDLLRAVDGFAEEYVKLSGDTAINEPLYGIQTTVIPISQSWAKTMKFCI